MRIEACGLHKTYGRRNRLITAVDDLSFTVEPGAVTGFLGPNGAGKTTTLRMVLGLVTPDAGTATIGGARYEQLRRPAEVVGASIEASGFHPARSGRDHLRILCSANGYASVRAAEVLDLVHLRGDADRAVGGYSLGMRQRLALAAALLGDPQVLVLDEPANGLDPEGIAWMRDLLRRYADRDRTVLVSSHLLTEMQQLADQVVIIDRGRLVRQGRLADLLGGARVLVRSPQVDRLRATLAASNGGQVEPSGAHGLRVTGLPAAEIGRVANEQRIELHELTTERLDLEALFLALTGRQNEKTEKAHTTATELGEHHAATAGS